ncbi:MAG: [FeFe] hydrogenase H-cluster radical SAM maturase HydG [Phycisphaerae bacterium]|nr:[FeFe] hydrogenase H-cluster radical SAM maturase HydG [Phycisphaerae bacterium]
MPSIPAPILSKTAIDFIDDDHLEGLLKGSAPQAARIREIIAKSLAKEPLSVEETCDLLLVEDPELVEEIFNGARQLKETVYGNRIVLFAPLYIGNRCVNNCSYCAFRSSNKDAIRRTLTPDEIGQQVEAMEKKGHKRLILVFGEHSDYDAKFIAESVRKVYETRSGHDEIRRVNINAAPLNHDDYVTVKESGIGTYQIFQETYHHETYAQCHPANTRKGNYLYRLDGLSRAMEAGCDDVGIGALFGLYDWRFETLALVQHALHLQQVYGVGPHTISFPRIQAAQGVKIDNKYMVNDDQFKRLVAILRLAVPYTGMILTARENPEVRRELLSFGVSQIDAGSRIELGGYTEVGDAQVMEREQFQLGDMRSLDEVMRELIEDGYLPSFCTACYRSGRTGEHFMEFAIPGFIKRFCTPNGLSTLMEYLMDYASPATRAAGELLIQKEVEQLTDEKLKSQLVERLDLIKNSKARDLYF